MIFVSAPLFLEKIATTERNPKCELYLVASRDGKSFDAPILVNEVKEMAAEALHSMAVAPDGTVHVVWLDAREGKGNCLFYARHAGGKFTKNVRLTNAVCPCCAPGMAIDGRGNRGLPRDGGRREPRIFATTSRDLGRTGRRRHAQ